MGCPNRNRRFQTFLASEQKGFLLFRIFGMKKRGRRLLLLEVGIKMKSIFRGNICYSRKVDYKFRESGKNQALLLKSGRAWAQKS